MVHRPAFDVLSDIVDACESHGGSVQSVEAAMGDTDVTVRLVVDHALEAGTHDVFTPESATVTEDGELCVQFRAPSLETLLPSTVPITPGGTETVAVTDEGALRCTHEFTLDPERSDAGETAPDPAATETAAGDAPAVAADPATDDGTATAATAQSELGAVRDESVPPYEDTAYLQALYDSCETFEEMSRLIEMDVVAETVRRYMVDAGVHTPDNYESDSAERDTEGVEDGGLQTAETDEDAATNPSTSVPADEQLVADGIGLPDGVGVTDLVDAVVEAATVYEVDRDLGLGHGKTRELLRRLGLLDQVTRRVADDHRGPVRDEVVRHIRRHGTA